MMEYTFNFQLKDGYPVKLIVEAEGYEEAFQKVCSFPCPECSFCLGRGTFPGLRVSSKITCPQCKGTGKHAWHVWRDKGYIDFIPYPEEEDESLHTLTEYYNLEKNDLGVCVVCNQPMLKCICDDADAEEPRE
jgi:hypothetical protein